MGNSGGTDWGIAIFHICMTLFTGGAWLIILVAWWIIKAASKK